MGSYGVMSPLFQGAVANQRRMLPGATKDDLAAAPAAGLGGAYGARPTAAAPGGVAATGMPGLPTSLSLSDLGQDLVDKTYGLRYPGGGDAGTDKYKTELAGVPGVFKGANAGNPYAERQASQYTGTKEWGPGLAGAFNDIDLLNYFTRTLPSMVKTGGLDPFAYNNWEAGNQARANTLDPYGLDRSAGRPNPYHVATPPTSVPPTNPLYYNQFQQTQPGGPGGDLTVGPDGNLTFGTEGAMASGEHGVPAGTPLDSNNNPLPYIPNTGLDPRLSTLTPGAKPPQRPPMFIPPPVPQRPNPFGAAPGAALTPEEQRIAHGWTPSDPYARGWGLSGGSGPSMQEIMGFYGGY